MSSNTITLIFCLGGLTFLFNWVFFLHLYFKNSAVQITDRFQLIKTFLVHLIISTIGVLTMGVLFVSALMISHG